MSPERIETELDGRHLSLSNLEKVFYPKVGFSKGAMLDYYLRVSATMLPHIANRPLTLRRFPNGVSEKSFFEKNVPNHLPNWIQTVAVPALGRTSSRRRESGEIQYVLVCDRPALIWAANLAAIEFHVPLWHVDEHETLPAPPDHLVFDLDPGPGTSIVECCQVGEWIVDRLARDDLGPALPKTSGSKGLQLYVPLTEELLWNEARDRAHTLAQEIERDHPDLVVTNMRKDLRKSRILIDWSQNHPVKTTVAAYSLRATDLPTASTPISLAEMHECARRGDPDRLRFLASDVIKRVEKKGDLMAPLLESRVRKARRGNRRPQPPGELEQA